MKIKPTQLYKKDKKKQIEKYTENTQNTLIKTIKA